MREVPGHILPEQEFSQGFKALYVVFTFGVSIVFLDLGIKVTTDTEKSSLLAEKSLLSLGKTRSYEYLDQCQLPQTVII